MADFKFGRRSMRHLLTCHDDLKKIAIAALGYSQVDFGIAEGHRSLERQIELFNKGRSKIDGINFKGKHNYSPSLAFDIYAYVNGRAIWEVQPLCYLAGVITATSDMLFECGDIMHRLRWGGNWDQDGEIITDQSFDDLVHFELIKRT